MARNMSNFKNDAIFWIEVDKIKPNPYQPRHEFDDSKIADLAESVRQYGILQPLVATRVEEIHEDGGMSSTYELIAGERRLRAAKVAGLSQVPVILRTGEEQDQMKLELAIIENLQREDLNPIDRALAFKRLSDEFGFKSTEIAKKIGKSREYVSNTRRLLALPETVQQALSDGKIAEGHARALLMVGDKPEAQAVLFRDIVTRHLNVRETEALARRTSIEKVRKKAQLSPETLALEQKITDMLGTRVRIDQRDEGGKIVIDFFSEEDLQSLLEHLMKSREEKQERVENVLSGNEGGESAGDILPRKEAKDTDDDLYSVKNFSV